MSKIDYNSEEQVRMRDAYYNSEEHVRVRGGRIPPENLQETMYFIRFETGEGVWFPESWLEEVTG